MCYESAGGRRAAARVATAASVAAHGDLDRIPPLPEGVRQAVVRAPEHAAAEEAAVVSGRGLGFRAVDVGDAEGQGTGDSVQRQLALHRRALRALQLDAARTERHLRVARGVQPLRRAQALGPGGTTR